MSRRKQQKPRHLDAEGDLPEALATEDCVTAAEVIDEGVESQTTPHPLTCPACNMQFAYAFQLLEHKQTCMPKFGMYDADNLPPETGRSDRDLHPDIDPHRDLDPRDEHVDPVSDDPDLDEEDDDEDDEEMGLMGDEEEDDVEEDEEGSLGAGFHTHPLPVIARPQHVTDEQAMDVETDDVTMDDANVDKSGQDAGVDPAPILPASNVKIESLENTKVAVAQFAENNMTPSDFMMLQSTLYNLQQQQLFQLQLLQQLQQHIAMGSSPGQLANLPLPAFLPGINPMLLHNMQKNLMAAAASGQAGNLGAAAAALGLNLNLPTSSTEDGSRDTDSTTGNDSQESTPSTPAPPSHDVSADVIKSTSAGVPPVDDAPIPPSTSTSNASLNGMSELVNMAHLNKDKPSQNADGKALETTPSQRPPYAADDPYFKYKCRFCHKVFGSDSALQIHIRSHTGERPFKCNICGNRFTTRGNLKVHFSRHKAQYPHIKMNPNPVPEHLDRLPIQPGGLPPPPNHAPMPMALPTPLMSTGAPLPHHMPPLIPMMHRLPAPDIKPSQPFNASQQQQQQQPQQQQQHRSSPSPKRRCSDERRMSSPKRTPSPSPRAESPVRTLVIQPTSLYGPPPLTSIPRTSMPLPNTLMSPIPAPMMPFNLDSSPAFPRGSILPQKAEDPMEQYMEVQKSETSKLEQLVKNIETKLTDPNQCAICHRILSCKSALQMHYRTHTGERPFKCKICGRAFTTKGNLKTHMGVHRAKPPMRMLHQCPVCHKQFTNAMVLQQHIRMHTGEVPKSLPLPMPMPGDMMMAAQAMGSMPFPAFPFFPPGMPGFPPHPPNMGGIDLRKPSIKPEGEQGKDGEYIQGRDEELYDGEEAGSRYSGEDEDMDDDDDFGDDMDEDNDVSREAPILDQQPQHQQPENDPQSPNDRQIPSPPSLVPVKQSLSPADKEEKQDYLSLYGEPSTASNQGNYPASSYSTSLQALEERVNAIETMDVRSQFNLARPLEQMEKIIERTDDNRGHHSEPYQGASPRRAEEARSPTRSDSNASSDSGKNSDGGQHAGPSPVTPPHNSFPFMPFRGFDTSPRSQEKSTTCDICYKTFACRSALDIHYRSHTQERPYLCDVCDRSFTTRGNLRQHLSTHKIRDLPEQAFNGDLPKPETSPHPSESTPSSHTPYQGSSGGSSASTITPPSDASKHKSPAQTPPSAAAASAATTPSSSSSPFMRKPNLRHMCQVCQKPFSSASALQIHMRTHTGDKPFKCTVCGKAFTTKGNLKVHMSTHMWNNGPSRRGRRMSVEGIPGLPPKEREFFNAFAHRGPSELFPFPFPGMPHHNYPHKMNEISVIQNLNGGMAHLPPTSAADAMLNHLHPMMKHPMIPTAELLRQTDSMIKTENDPKLKEIREANNNSSKSDYGPPSGTNGELDLSMRKSSPSSSHSPSASSAAQQSTTSPKMPLPQQQPHPESAANPAWLWKTTCHLCNKSCSSSAALEIHMKSHMQMGASPGQASPKPLMA